MRRLSMLIGLALALAAPAAAQPTTVDTFPGKVIVASTASDALTVAGDVIVHSTGSGNKVLTLGSSPSTNATALIKLVGSNSATNWQIGTNGTTAGAFELTPSTAGGGTTFTTPVLTLNGSGVLTVNGFGTHAFTSGANGAQEVQITNTTSSTAAYAGIRATAGTNVDLLIAFSQGYTTSGVNIASSMLLQSTGSGGISLAATDAAGIIRMYSGGANLRWGVNSAGDFTYGASSHIADSGGTIVFNSAVSGSGSPTVTGTDYAFTLVGGLNNTQFNLNFGHTWTTAPACVVSMASGPVALANLRVSATTTTITIGDASSSYGTSPTIYGLCRGY